MKTFFLKHETLCCISLIILYIVSNMFISITSYSGVIVNTLLSIFLLGLIIYLGRVKYYGLVSVKDSKKFLYFIPLMLIISVNLWNGININNSVVEIICHIISMINIGFIEEIIFRGFLFKMMAKDDLKSAIIVSSITFGIGHIINLFTGGEFLSTLMQIFYCISIGYLFVMIFYKSGSLIPCIMCHSIFNALSIFYVDGNLFYLSSIFLIVVPLVYTYYIKKNFGE